MNGNLDWDGQPLNAAYNWRRRLDRGMDELIGIARGVLADGRLVKEEAEFMLRWLERNEPVRRDYFGRFLFEALGRALADNELTAEEEDALIGMLLSFVGPEPHDIADASYSTSLPLDDPPPQVELAGKHFCFTGKFVFGSRRECEVAVQSWGAAIHQYPTFKTHYLVIGDLGSRDWIHSTSGRKIERAIEIRSKGYTLKLVSEQHWVACVECVDETPQQPLNPLPYSAGYPRAFGEPLVGKTLVVTGALKKYKRDEIEALIQQLGGRASGSVSKKTNYVVAGEEAGSKLEKARQLGVPVLSEDEFDRLIGK